MPTTRRDWIVMTIVVAVVGVLWINATRVQADAINPTGRPPAAQIGHPAPDFTLATPDGGQLSLSDFRGQPVILNFWATWCPPCRAEIPALQAAWQGFEGDGVILGVDVQEDVGRVASFMLDFGMTYPVALDSSAAVSQTYRVQAFPTTYFIDDRGVVVDIYTGPLNEPLLHTRLAALRSD